MGSTGYEPGGDAADYDRHATAIAASASYPESQLVPEGGPTAFRPPAYPLLLGAVYTATGDSTVAGLVAQALLGTLIVALVGSVGSLIWGRTVALVAMAIAAVYPPLLVLGAALISEPLFIVFELAALVVALVHQRSEHPYRWVALMGLLIGLATLTRVNGLVGVLPLAVFVWFVARARGEQPIRPVALLLTVTVAVIAPWSIRNAIEFDEFLPLTTQDGFALARNYNDLAQADPVYPSAPHDTEEVLRTAADPDSDEAEAAGALGELGRGYMREHPGYVVETVARNTARMAHLDGTTLGKAAAETIGVGSTLALVGIYSFYGFALVALVGVVVPSARRASWIVWVTPVLMLLPALLIAAGRTRYRAPIEPIIVLLVALGLIWAWQSLLPRILARGQDRQVG